MSLSWNMRHINQTWATTDTSSSTRARERLPCSWCHTCRSRYITTERAQEMKETEKMSTEITLKPLWNDGRSRKNIKASPRRWDYYNQSSKSKQETTSKLREHTKPHNTNETSGCQAEEWQVSSEMLCWLVNTIQREPILCFVIGEKIKTQRLFNKAERQLRPNKKLMLDNCARTAKCIQRLLSSNQHSHVERQR